MTTKKKLIPEDHPRYLSLMTREKLVDGFKKGLVAHEGLIAHGRGEAFDYMIGERTVEPAKKAINAAAALLLLAENPVISVNGNTAALCPRELCELNQSLERSSIEINLFYHTLKREKSILNCLKKYSSKEILGTGNKEFKEIPELKSNRRRVDPDGIYKADLVFVPLEDGDRTISLKKMNKKVISVDLNPMSRTSLASDITIVDNIVRALPQLIESVKFYKKNFTKKALKDILNSFDNKKALRDALEIMKSSEILA